MKERILPMRMKSVGCKRFIHLDRKFASAHIRGYILEEFSYEEFDELKSLFKSFCVENSMREKDKARIMDICEMTIKNSMPMIERMMDNNKFVFSHINLVFNSKSALFTEFRNIYKKYEIGGLLVHICVDGRFNSILILELFKNATKDKFYSSGLYIDFKLDPEDRSKLLEPIDYSIELRQMFPSNFWADMVFKRIFKMKEE